MSNRYKISAFLYGMILVICQLIIFEIITQKGKVPSNSLVLFAYPWTMIFLLILLPLTNSSGVIFRKTVAVVTLIFVLFGFLLSLVGLLLFWPESWSDGIGWIFTSVVASSAFTSIMLFLEIIRSFRGKK